MRPLVGFLCVSVVAAVLIVGDVVTRPTSGAAPSDTSGEAVPANLVAVRDSQQVVSSQTQRRDDPELNKSLRKYDLVKLDPKQIHTTGELRLRTSAQDFELKLTPHDLRAKDYRAQVIGTDGSPRELPRTPVYTYSGRINGTLRGEARLTITKDTIQGAIITEAGRYFLQPARSLSKDAQADEFVFYKDTDVTGEPASCGVTLAQQVAAQADQAAANDKLTSSAISATEPASLVPLKVIRLATEADAEYVAALGGPVQANNQILSIMNQVEGIYEYELGITFQIVFQNAWPTRQLILTQL